MRTGQGQKPQMTLKAERSHPPASTLSILLQTSCIHLGHSWVLREHTLPAHVQSFIHQYTLALLLRAALNPSILQPALAPAVAPGAAAPLGTPAAQQEPAAAAPEAASEGCGFVICFLRSAARCPLPEQPLLTAAVAFPLGCSSRGNCQSGKKHINKENQKSSSNSTCPSCRHPQRSGGHRLPMLAKVTQLDGEKQTSPFPPSPRSTPTISTTSSPEQGAFLQGTAQGRAN